MTYLVSLPFTNAKQSIAIYIALLSHDLLFSPPSFSLSLPSAGFFHSCTPYIDSSHPLTLVAVRARRTAVEKELSFIPSYCHEESRSSDPPRQVHETGSRGTWPGIRCFLSIAAFFARLHFFPRAFPLEILHVRVVIDVYCA